MTYKRATKQLRDAGITDINIDKSLFGAVPHLIGVWKQRSTVFKSPSLATQAVLDGFRPADLTEGQPVPEWREKVRNIRIVGV